MDNDYIERLSEKLYPDEYIPRKGTALYGEPDIIVSHEKERNAFIEGFHYGFTKGRQTNENKKHPSFR